MAGRWRGARGPGSTAGGRFICPPGRPQSRLSSAGEASAPPAPPAALFHSVPRGSGTRSRCLQESHPEHPTLRRAVGGGRTSPKDGEGQISHQSPGAPRPGSSARGAGQGRRPPQAAPPPWRRGGGAAGSQAEPPGNEAMAGGGWQRGISTPQPWLCSRGLPGSRRLHQALPTCQGWEDHAQIGTSWKLPGKPGRARGWDAAHLRRQMPLLI